MFDRDDINLDFNSNYTGDNGINYNDIDITMDSDNNSMNESFMGSICEDPKINVIHRTFYHDEEHIVPVRTHIINHHIIRHYFRPCFSCSEENIISNVCCPNNCNM